MYIILILLSLLMPLALLAVGLILNKYSPKKINSSVGYRTTRSKKNIETWNEANNYSIKLLIKYSLLVLLVIILAAIFVGRSYNSLGAIIMLSVILSLVTIIRIVILTEKHLKNMFGE